MSTTTTKPKPMKVAERELLIKWLKHFDQWLWLMRVSTRDAVAFAKEDGLSFASRNRMTIYARRTNVCERWRVEEQSESATSEITSSGWDRLIDFIEKHKKEIIDAGSVVGAYSMARRAGRRASVFAVQEALRARNISLPMRIERPKFVADAQKASAA